MPYNPAPQAAAQLGNPPPFLRLVKPDAASPESLASTAGNDDEARILSALTALPADDYEAWWQTGLALHRSSLPPERAYQLWRDWSATCPAKFSEQGCAEKWASYVTASTPDAAITLATVFHRAKQTGWIDPARAETAATAAGDEGDRELINQLAALPLLQYERQRHEAAERLGISRLAILDKIVVEARAHFDKEGNEETAGKRIQFADVEPWPERVDAAAVLDATHDLIRRHVIADPETLHAATLWAALTWFAEHATVLPLALITAPEKGCGKSVLLATLARLARKSLLASNISGPALFRTIEKYSPALFLDEGDTYLDPRNHPELVGVINSGHTRDTAFVIRTVGDEHEPAQFSTWCPKAIAGISAHRLSETITSRSVILQMRRKAPGESCETLRHAAPELFETVQRQLARMSLDNGMQFSRLRPTMDGLHNRNADNWEPILAIADLAGGSWPQLARHAASKLCDVSSEAPSINQELLADIQVILAKLNKPRVPTNMLLDELARLEESPWATFSRGKAMTARQLAKRLADFGIKPRQIKFEHGNHNGYVGADFEDAFQRYLE